MNNGPAMLRIIEGGCLAGDSSRGAPANVRKDLLTLILVDHRDAFRSSTCITAAQLRDMERGVAR